MYKIKGVGLRDSSAIWRFMVFGCSAPNSAQVSLGPQRNVPAQPLSRTVFGLAPSFNSNLEGIPYP